jgi:hypothetical protein
MNKKMPRKLSLCTETLRSLDQLELQNVAGGSLANTLCAACDNTATRVCSGCAPCA